MKGRRKLIDVFLQPGELFVGDASYKVRTVLGSCVSMTLWHPATRIGGMSHFLLPARSASEPVAVLDGRYGDEALELMLRELKQSGVPACQCQSKIFGGGNMFPGQMGTDSINIGQRNGEAAIAMLQRHGIPVMSQSLFGVGHRQVIFDLSSGDVWSRLIAPSEYDEAKVTTGDLL